MARPFPMIALLAALAFPSPVRAQSPAVDASRFSTLLATDYRVTSNITYGTASGMDLKLDVYRPARATGPLPTVLFFHGGGYRLASKKENSVLNVLPYVHERQRSPRVCLLSFQITSRHRCQQP